MDIARLRTDTDTGPPPNVGRLRTRANLQLVYKYMCQLHSVLTTISIPDTRSRSTSILDVDIDVYTGHRLSTDHSTR